MRGRSVFLACMVITAAAAGACASQTPHRIVGNAPTAVAPVKPDIIEPVFPARFVLTANVGALYDENGTSSPIRSRDAAIVIGKRLMLEGGVIVDSASFVDNLVGFRSLPARLGGGYVFWSDEHSYHAPTFLGKLEPFAKIGARGGVRPWFDSFILRTELGSLEVNPPSFTVRRTDLARFSEMISLDGKIGVRTDPVGHREVSIDGGKTFRSLTFDGVGKWIGPMPGSSSLLLFHRDLASDWAGMRENRPIEMRVINASGALVPFDPTAGAALSLDLPGSSSPDEPALTRSFAPVELAQAAAAGALLPGDRVAVMRESSIRVLSAKTGELIQDVPLSLSTQEFGHCQPIVLGEDLFLACTHASGAHVLAVRGSPSVVQLEATFPEARGFVAGLGQRFAFLGRCGSTPPTFRDFLGYASTDEPDGGEADPNAPPAPPDPADLPDVPVESPPNEAAVCVRLKDGSWVERRIDGLVDRKKAYFLPGDDGNVTVVVFDKPAADKPTPTEGVRFIHVDPKAAGFRGGDFFKPNEPSEPPVRTILRDVWLDAKDGSVHGWELQLSEDEEPTPTEEDESSEVSNVGMMGLDTSGRIVGVQIKPDGSIERHALPDEVENVFVGGPHALARAKTDAGPKYYESTDGGRTFVAVAGPVPGDFIEPSGGELEGCSIVGCSLGGGLVRLGWGDGSPGVAATADAGASEELDALTSKAFDPYTLLPPKLVKAVNCRLEDKGNGASVDDDAPFAVTTQTLTEANIGSPALGKWTAVATSPFELRPPHQVLFEDVDAEALKGAGVPLLRSTVTNPVGLFLRTNDSLFDLSPGSKRKPRALASDVRGSVAAELDRDTFVLFDPRHGDVQLVRGAIARQLMRINQVPDVTFAGLTLARRTGAGPDVLAVAIVHQGSGDILLGELDMGRMAVGPLRVAGNMRKLDTGPSCVRGPRDYRMVVDERTVLRFQPQEERTGIMGSSLVTVGSGNVCLEASEFRLGSEGTVVVRYSEAGPGGYLAMLHEHGKSFRARCNRE